MKPNLIEDWVRQAQQGNVDAFNQLVDSLRTLAFREAYRWLGDEQLAEDATQDAFLAAYQHIEQLRQPKKFVAWLRQIVRSQCNLRTRRKKLKTESFDEREYHSAKTPTPENIVQRREEAESLHEALQSLPEHERIVTEEYYLNGKKQSEIAEDLDIPLTTVKKRLQYARKKLKGLVEQLTVADTERLFSHLYPMWRKLKHYEDSATKIFGFLFFTDYTNIFAYRKPDDQSGNRDMDL